MNKTIFKRTENNTNFTKIPNNLLRDKNLSLSAKALLSILLSNIDGWIIYRKKLMKEYNLSKSKINLLFVELKKAGYIEINKIKDSNNKFFGGYEYIVKDYSNITNKGEIINE